jgi:hypothetical protein
MVMPKIPWGRRFEIPAWLLYLLLLAAGGSMAAGKFSVRNILTAESENPPATIMATIPPTVEVRITLLEEQQKRTEKRLDSIDQNLVQIKDMIRDIR